jgi:carbamoyltransferase
VAAEAQALLEEAAISAVQGALGETIAESGCLCLAGGVAMNVALNRKLGTLTGVRRVYVPPAPGDAGCAAGAAAWVARERGEAIAPLATSFLGPAFSRDAIRSLLCARKIPFAEPPDPHAECADAIARGEIAGWFEGRMEFGPRALGGRSILAHPGRKGTADRINATVKYRESWRPFCPSVLAEEAGDWFEEPFDSPFMSFAFTVKPARREAIGETVHVDGTSRAQIVTAARAPGLRAVIEAFHAGTGVPAVLNASLNRRGEPIARTPEDALAVFFGSGLDRIYLEGLCVAKARPSEPRAARGV